MKNLPPLSPDLSPQAAAEFAEIRRIMREAEEERKAAAAAADKRAAEYAAEAAKYAAEAAERAAEADKRGVAFDARLDKLSRDIATTEKMIDDVGKQMGFEGNATGKELENDVADALVASGDLCGIPLEDVRPNMQSRKHACQFDIVAINGKKIIAVEVKRKLSVKDVYTFAGVRLPRFATAFPEVAHGKQVIGAMIYRLVDDQGKAVAAALDEGLLVLRADGNKKLHQIKSTEEITAPVKKSAGS